MTLFDHKTLAPLIILAIAAILPAILPSNYYLSILIMTGIWIMLASGLNLVVGYTGQVSMCHAAFYGVGAYTSALLVVKAGWPFWYAFAAAGLVSGGMGILVGMASNKLSGHYLAIGTLAFGVIVTAVLERCEALTYPAGEGAMIRGISRPEAIAFLGIDFRNLSHYYYLVLLVVVATVWITHRLGHSQFGRVLIAIREDELLAQSVGIWTSWYKVQAFAIGAGFAGLAGSLYAHYSHNITPGSFVFLESFYMVVAVILGGAGSTSGPLLGATFIRVIQEILRMRVPQPWVPDLTTLLFGVILIVVILFAPSGLVGLGQHLKVPWGTAARRVRKPVLSREHSARG